MGATLCLIVNGFAFRRRSNKWLILDSLASWRRRNERIVLRSNNCSRLDDPWLFFNGVRMHVSMPGVAFPLVVFVLRCTSIYDTIW